MTTCRQILTQLDSIAPLCLAEDFDNVGLVFGRADREVRTALLCLNVNRYTVDEAIREKADLIISHHPLTFSGDKKITDETSLGRLQLDLAEHRISVIAMHTNLDSAEGGLNDQTAKRLSLTVTEAAGCVRFCTTQTMSLGELIDRVKKAYALPVLKYTGKTEKPVSKIAVCTGSGKSFIDEVIAHAADVYITGDVSYSAALSLEEAGVCLVDLGHFESEHICRDLFCTLLDGLDDVRLVLSKEPNVFSYR